ncbi:MAG: hypothetical protein DRO87_03080 [Candidatus Thorarchaeota archaeon]|nr:MAG: hypothetical protein DRP09_08180 [Candidatus Thorarchaeota archaeon]RLI59393.1 MAG: hypothetical protein DRO87_03080 [Candidatus Thorarchaeota archaeon]
MTPERNEGMAEMNVDFSYYCYRCGSKNTLNLPCPPAPEYHETELTCSSCGDGTRVILSHCPKCSRYVYWISDMSIPSLVEGFAKYMVHSMQIMIDNAARQGATISIDTPETYPINARCPCGESFAVEIPIPDLD